MRIICSKFHVEGDKIVKTTNGEPIPDDEPIFLIRGRDRLAVALLEHYVELSQKDGCNDWHFDLLKGEIDKFMKFRKDFPERMKQPSVTRGR